MAINKVVYGDTTLIDITDTDALATDVLNSKWFYTSDGTKTQGTATGGTSAISVVDTTDTQGGTVRTITALNISDTTAVAADVAQGKYFYTANGTKTQGTASGGTYQAKTNINPSTSSQTITPDSGYDALSSVQINAMPSGTAGTPTATKGTVSNHSVSITPSVTNVTGYITGGTKTGSAVTVSASELVSGTLSIDSSGTKDVTNYASVSVSSGSVSAPTATKGTVSNHSISVTPSVTHTAGYIAGGSKSGTAVTVSASELVSGSETKTENGTYDVTNLAQLIVNVAGGGATQHIIHLEFSDSTDTDIEVDYDNSWVGSLITSTEPTSYGVKAVILAQLDGVTWYEYSPIPLNTQLIDYTACEHDKSINSSGEVVTTEWYHTSDYTPIAAGMTFTYTASLWHYIAFYDSSKAVIDTIYVYSDGTQDPNDSNTGHGTLSGNKIPSNAAYVRLCGTWYDSDHISLIRTA